MDGSCTSVGFPINRKFPVQLTQLVYFHIYGTVGMAHRRHKHTIVSSLRF